MPPFVEHNWAKYSALKKAFYLTALDGIEGDYLEFGIFTGSSLIAATRMHHKMHSVGKVRTKFWGFDSFEGFGEVSDGDRHPFYVDSIFKVDKAKVSRNILRKTKGSDVEIVPGYFDRSLAEATAQQRGVQKARVLFIDCDLKDPAKLALDWASSLIQPGTIVILDDYFSYRGDPNRGVAGAFREFREQHPHLSFRPLFSYGYGGAAYIVSSVDGAPTKSSANHSSTRVHSPAAQPTEAF